MGLGEIWSGEPDVHCRDVNQLNEHLRVHFWEIIGEIKSPSQYGGDSTASLDCVWRYSYKCFNFWKTLCYIILTTICGIPLAMCWGCYFACIAFEHIWEITPCIRAWEINLQGLNKCFRVIVHACLDPCYEATSGLFIAFKGSDV